MNVPLYYDETNTKWILLGKVLKIFDSRKTHQELAKNELTPLKSSVNILKVVMIALFFDLPVSYTVSELNRDKKLKKQLCIEKIHDQNQIYEFLSRFGDVKFYEFVIKLLNSLNFKNNREIKTILVDGTDIQIDLNWHGRKISKKSLEKKPYKWGYSSSKGFYIGLKLTLALNCETMQPLAMLIHEGTPNDALIFDEIMHKLKKRRIIRNGDKIFFDKGYFSRENYQIAITKYKTSPLIFPRGKNQIRKVFDNLSYSLDCFKGKSRDKSLYKSLATKSREKLENWEDYKGIRSKIEDFNKLLKQCFSLTKIHHYTKESINKKIYLNVLLGGITTSLGFRTKKALQQLSEM